MSIFPHRICEVPPFRQTMMLFAQIQCHRPKSSSTFLAAIRAKPLSTFSSPISLCNDTQVHQIHARYILLGLHQNAAVSSDLIDTYANLGHLRSAQQVFYSVKHPPNALLSNTLFRNLLKLCSRLQDVRKIHAHVVKLSYETSDLSVNTALLSLYLKFGSLETAQLVFEKMPERDCAVWNLMISGYSRNGYCKEALELVSQMIRSGLRPDLFTAIATISCVGELKSVQHGRQIHSHAIRNGLDYQVSVHNSLIDMYGTCGHVETAQKVFDSLSLSKTEVSWSSMIKAYGKNDRSYDALYVFFRMKMDGIRPDSIHIINVLPACVSIGGLELVKCLHCYSLKLGFDFLPTLATSLLISYSKCGCIEMAQRLFDEGDINDKDLVSWNSMISAYSKHGKWSQCFQLYDRMKKSHLRPDRITFLELLTACVNSGFVDKGWECFKEMTERYHCHPNQEHYGCMVDLLGRAGHVDEAMALIKTMPFKADARVWSSLLSACKLHPQNKLAEHAAKELFVMEPNKAGNYVLLSNIYAAAGKWDGVAMMRSILKDRGLKKTPGWSSIEINGHVHEFRVAHHSHPQSEDIYTMLRYLQLEIDLDRQRKSST